MAAEDRRRDPDGRLATELAQLAARARAEAAAADEARRTVEGRSRPGRRPAKTAVERAREARAALT